MKTPSNLPIPLSFLFLLTLMLLTTGSPPSFAATDTLLDRIVATVNQNVITDNQLKLAISDTEKGLQASGTPIPDASTLRTKVLDQLINEKLALEAAKDAGVTVSDEDIQKAIQQIASQNNLSIDTLLAKIKEQGMDVDRWKNDLKDQLLIQKMQQQEVGATLSVTKEEVEAYEKALPPPDPARQEYHVRDLLIPLPEDPSENTVGAAKKLADKIARELHQKKNIDISQITISDRGWQTLSQMPSIFAEHVALMTPHSYSAVLRTGNGFHILHLAGIRSPEGNESLTPAEIRKKLIEQKYEKGVKKWIALLRSRATIQLYPDS